MTIKPFLFNKPAPNEWYEKRPELPRWLLDVLFNRLGRLDLIDTFLMPRFEDLPSPFLFSDMEKVVDRIIKAIQNGEKICIYADYDADAVTAAAVMIRGLRYIGANVTYYIPDRFTEGYGVNKDAIRKIIEDGSSVIITVDCGTNSNESAEEARKLGAAFIVTDHHEMLVPEFPVVGLINPKAPKESYPEKQITGVGVAYKVISALYSDDRVKNLNPDFVAGYEKWLLDLVAIGTVADCHSLIGENRIFVSFGLKVLHKTRWQGLLAMLDLSGSNEIDERTLGFTLAPRINAAGRLEHASLALDLLIEDDPQMAVKLALQLEQVNDRRKDLAARLVSEAKAKTFLNADKKIIIVYDENWPRGVVGLVASRLSNEFGKPSIVLEKGSEFSIGSARSVGSFDIISALQAMKSHLHTFGGHKQAAGLTVLSSKLDEFTRDLEEYVEENMSEDDLQEYLAVDSVLDAQDLNLSSAAYLQKLKPFGVGNPSPLFSFQDNKISSWRAVGKDGKHLQFEFEIGSVRVPGIAFNAAHVPDKYGEQWPEMACEVFIDNFGRPKVKVKLIALKQ